MSHYVINMKGMYLNDLVHRIPHKPGRYHLILSRIIMVEAKELFDYDSHRHPPHPHFINYGKSIFELDYIAHYLLPNIENKKITESYDDLDLHLYYEIL